MPSILDEELSKNILTPCKLCPICFEIMTEDVMSPEPCQDIFHEFCIKEWLQVGRGAAVKCPVCSCEFSKLKSVSQVLSQEEKNETLLNPSDGIAQSTEGVEKKQQPSDYFYVQESYGNIMNITKSSDESGGEDENRVDSQKQEISNTFSYDLRQLMQEKVHADKDYSFRFKVLLHIFFHILNIQVTRQF